MYKVRAVYTPPAEAELWFDNDYYFTVHVPMMQRDFPGKVPFTGVDVETKVETLCRTDVANGVATSATPAVAELITPLVANIYFGNRDDAYAFADFVTGPDAAGLHADISKYTNCGIHWTVGELHQPG